MSAPADSTRGPAWAGDSPSRGRGLCPACAHARRTPGRNTVFLRCARAQDDPRYPKYPPQPVLVCPGHVPERAPGREREG